jgi:excinuclease UvrABC helicase subunit UvrB
MPSKTKNFSAISEFLTPQNEEKIEDQTSQINIREGINHTQDITPEPVKKSVSNVKTKTSKIVKKVKEEEPESSGFTRWTTYIKPELLKKLKYKALEEDKEIYRLVEEALLRYLK